MTRRLLYVVLTFMLLAGCATTVPPKDYTNFRIENPRSILIVPVINRSVDVDAPDYFLSTATLPLAERGYYVFPVNIVKRLLEDDGLSDANMVHSADATRVAELFGSDAVLYISIERWDAKYTILTTTVTVQFAYNLKSGKTGETLWEHKETLVYSPQQQNSGNAIVDIFAQLITAAVTKAAPNYVPLARQANGTAINMEHQGLPAGPYHELYNKDQENF